MPVKTEKELNESLRSHWLKAVAAVEMRNFGYAISLLQGLLKQEPQFLMGRQLLRHAEIAKLKSEKKRLFNLSTASIGVMKAQRELKKDPKRAVELIEKVLEDEPLSRQANLVLKDAAVAAGWPEIGVLALQTLLEEKPGDTKLLHELGRLYHDIGDSDKEVEIYNRITEADPGARERHPGASRETEWRERGGFAEDEAGQARHARCAQAAARPAVTARDSSTLFGSTAEGAQWR